MTGRDFGAARLAAGIPANTMAKAVGVACDTLHRREQNLNELAQEEEQRWRVAFKTVFIGRAQHYAHDGFTLEEVIQGRVFAQTILGQDQE